MEKEIKYFLTPDHVKIHYIDQGPVTGISALTLIFVPGWAYSCNVFEKQIEYFSKSYRVLAIDPRGHGNSDRTEIGISYEQQTKDLIALMDKLSIQDAVLIGWSYGAYTTWGVIREIGTERIRGIFNIDQPPKCTEDNTSHSLPVKEWTEYLPENIERAKCGLSTDEGYRKGIENFTKNTAFINAKSEKELLEVCKMADMDREPAYMEFLSGASCDFTKEAIDVDRTANCPAEMIVRENWADIALPYMNHICPNTPIHVFGGHMMFYEFPDKYNQILEDLIKRLEQWQN